MSGLGREEGGAGGLARAVLGRPGGGGTGSEAGGGLSRGLAVDEQEGLAQGLEEQGGAVPEGGVVQADEPLHAPALVLVVPGTVAERLAQQPAAGELRAEDDDGVGERAQGPGQEAQPVMEPLQPQGR